MKIHKYRRYADYVAAQNEANARKINNVWVRPETIEKIFDHQPFGVKAILCHGTRNGAEQKLFMLHFPGAHVLGTDIADTAKDFPNTVQHDFHKPRGEWIGQFQIVYSNAWDHALHPKKALGTWRDQLAPSGRLFLEHGNSAVVNVSTESDPLEISHEEILAMLEEVGLRLLTTFDAFGIKGVEDHKSIVYVAERA
jgi:hypothetical protein